MHPALPLAPLRLVSLIASTPVAGGRASYRRDLNGARASVYSERGCKLIIFLLI